MFFCFSVRTWFFLTEIGIGWNCCNHSLYTIVRRRTVFCYSDYCHHCYSCFHPMKCCCCRGWRNSCCDLRCCGGCWGSSHLHSELQSSFGRSSEAHANKERKKLPLSINKQIHFNFVTFLIKEMAERNGTWKIKIKKFKISLWRDFCEVFLTVSKEHRNKTVTIWFRSMPRIEMLNFSIKLLHDNYIYMLTTENI